MIATALKSDIPPHKGNGDSDMPKPRLRIAVRISRELPAALAACPGMLIAVGW